MRHQNQFAVKSFDIDRFGGLSTSSMFYHMQEIAWEHAHILGFGYDHLKEDQQYWVLSRLLVKISRNPGWKEELVLETWSRGTDGFYGYRDFEFIDQSGEIIISATSSWLVLDLATKRIQRLIDKNGFSKFEPGIFGRNASKVNSPVSPDILVFTPVLFNEIDINQHFNTGRYLERICDSFDFSFHDAHNLAELEVNFLKEGMPQDRLAVKKQALESHIHLCSVNRESDGAELVRAKLTWKERSKS